MSPLKGTVFYVSRSPDCSRLPNSYLSTLCRLQIPFALFSSNATFVWIENVDESMVRQYRNIEFIIRREDSELVSSALTGLYLSSESHDDHILLRNKHIQKDHWSDRAFFAGEQLASHDVELPPLEATATVNDIPVVSLHSLVVFQLRRFKLDDKVDLRDLIEVGLVDQSWPAKLPPELAARLQTILDNPEG